MTAVTLAPAFGVLEAVDDPDMQNHTPAAMPVQKESKDRKKKTRKPHKGLASSSKAESDWDTVSQGNRANGNVEDENGMKTPIDRDQLPIDQQIYTPAGSNAQLSNQCLQEEEVWEVASSKKSRRKDASRRNQYGSAHQATGWAQGGHSVKKSGRDSSPDPSQNQGGVRPQSWRSNEAPIQGSRRQKETVQYKLKSPASGGANGEEKWESMMIKGKGKSYTGGSSSTSLDNDLSRNVDTNAHESGLTNHPVVVTSVSDKSSDARSAGCPPHVAGVWQRSYGATSISGNSTWYNVRNRFDESHLPSNSWPSEKQGGLLESTHRVGNVGPGLNSAERSENFAAPSKHISDSICLNDGLGDDDDLAGSEGWDSDASEVSHETWKKDTLFKQFFDSMAAISVDQLNEHDKQWHCPVCQDAIDSHRGLQSLLAHASTVRSKRVKLHRKFAKVLEEEVNILGRSSINNEEMFGKWKGPCQDGETVNPLIVWPPAIIVQNTQLELDEHDKWIGMGNEELRDHFKNYQFSKARHAYGPQGHRGMSILVFPDTPLGYMDAQRLAKHFIDSRRARQNWDRPGKVLFHPGGMRILYGYMATEEDMNIFNKHTGKSKLKWNQRRLQEVVVQPMKQMDEDNYQLNQTNQKNERLTEENKILEKTFAALAEKLRLKDKEIETIRQRALEQHQENQQEMDQLELVYKAKVKELSTRRAEREDEIQQQEEDFTQDHIRHVQQLEKTCVVIPKEDTSEIHIQSQRAKIKEEIAQRAELVEISLKDTEDYEFQKKEIMRKHHLKKVEFMRQQHEQMLKFEKELEEEKLALQERYLH